MSLRRAQHLLPTTQQWRNWLRPYSHAKQERIDPKNMKKPEGFKVTDEDLVHMQALREWLVHYSPVGTNYLERQAELHRINNEQNYREYRKFVNLLILWPLAWFIIFKLKKDKYMNQGNKDSVEMQWTNTQALHQ